MTKPKKAPSFPRWFKIKRYDWARCLFEEDPLALYWEFKYRVGAMTLDDVSSWVYPLIQTANGRLTLQPLSLNASSIGTQIEVDSAYEQLVEGNIYPYLPGEPGARPMSMGDLSLLLEQSSPNALTSIDRSGRSTNHNDLTSGPYSTSTRRLDIKERLSIDTHRYSRLSPVSDGDLTAHCTIDLNYSDDAIALAIRSLLPKWRGMLAEIKQANVPEDKTANRELEKIVDYKLIPTLDLMLWSKHTQQKITERVMVAKLSDGGEYDFSEGNFRKTALPMLDKLMSDEWSMKLYSAALSRSILINAKLAAAKAKAAKARRRNLTRPRYPATSAPG